MKIRFKGKLVDEKGKAIKSSKVRGCAFTSSGSLSPIAESKTNTRGDFLMRAARDFHASPMPRVAVQVFHKNKWLMLTDQVKSFNNGVADFSNIVFHETALYKLGTTPYHGDNHTVTTSTPVVLRSLTQPIRILGEADTGSVSGMDLSKINDLKKSLSTLEKQKVELARDKKAIEKTLSEQKNVIKLKDQALARTRADLTKKFKGQLAGKDDEIARLLNENKDLKKATPDRVNIDDIAFSTGIQIESVQRRLSAGNSSLRLNKVSLQMKGLADPSGKAMVLPPKKDIAALASGMSVLHLDFVPQIMGKVTRPPETDSHEEPPKLTDFRGQTEASARRQLDAAGLPYRVYKQPLEPDDTKNLGRVVHQTPVADSPLDDQTVIKLIVGKAPDETSS